MRSRTRSGAPALAAAGALFAGCGGEGEGSDRSTATRRDSVGVEIVENPLSWDEAGSFGRLALPPLLDLGVVEGDPAHQFHQVYDAARLPDGRLVVLDNGSREVRFFGPDGRHLRTLGGTGEGPGEFRSIWWVGRLPGDSLIAWDHRLQRLTVFSYDGELGRTTKLDPPFLNEPSPHSVLETGDVLLTYTDSPWPRGSGCYEVRMLQIRYSTAGTFRDTVGQYAYRTMCPVEGSLSNLQVWPDFEAMTSLAAGPASYVVTTGDAFEIRVHTSEGRLQRLIRWRGDRLPVTPEAVAEYRRRELDRYERFPDFQREIRLGQEGRPVSELFPTTRGLVVDRLGRIWARRYELPGYEGPQDWLVFDERGEMLGTVQLPPGFRVREIGGDYVLGVLMDELEVEHVLLYGLEVEEIGLETGARG